MTPAISLRISAVLPFGGGVEAAVVNVVSSGGFAAAYRVLNGSNGVYVSAALFQRLEIADQVACRSNHRRSLESPLRLSDTDPA
ncbi:MAG: hypothetical protein JO015_00970 [Verrucomicrobia bacterium]|nr:hypothetical protein [Verrucomicrobiota bacterium]